MRDLRTKTSSSNTTVYRSGEKLSMRQTVVFMGKRSCIEFILCYPITKAVRERRLHAEEQDGIFKFDHVLSSFVKYLEIRLSSSKKGSLSLHFTYSG